MDAWELLIGVMIGILQAVLPTRSLMHATHSLLSVLSSNLSSCGVGASHTARVRSLLREAVKVVIVVGRV